MTNITINPQDYPYANVNKTGTKLTASVGHWKEIISAINSNTYDESSEDENQKIYWTQDKEIRDLYGNSLSDEDHTRLANWIQSKLDSQREQQSERIKVLSWNVGIGRRGESWGFEQWKKALPAGKLPDVIFLQEVPQFRKNEMVGVDIFFNRKFWSGYHAFNSSRTFVNGKSCDYVLVTLVKKGFLGDKFFVSEVRITNTPFALIVLPQDPDKKFPSLINVHLKADNYKKMENAIAGKILGNINAKQ